MKTKKAAAKDPSDEITALVLRLQETQHLLQKLTRGEVDAVLAPGGESYLLQEAQEKLRQSEAVQRGFAALQASILNALPAHIALIDHEGVILSVNEGWRSFAGSNGLQSSASGLGQNYLEICERAQGDCAEEAIRAAAGIREVLAGAAGEFSLEYPCHSPTEQRWFRLMVAPLDKDRPEGAAIMHINITERKRVQEAVRESEERFRSMFTAAATGIAISTPQGRFLQANAAYSRMLGYTEDELRALNFAELTHPEDLTLNLKLRDEMLTGERESLVMEKRYVKKNGDIVWTRHSVAAVRTAGGEVTTFIVVAEDFTERKLAEFRLHRLNRLHTVLSKVGEAILRTRDRQELYDTVCRIVVEDGGLRMVFIAEVDAEAGVARPVASCGEGRDYLWDPTSTIPLDGGPLSHGTVGRALRTGRRDFCNDIAGTARMKPWHETTRKFGLRSNASFPFHLRGITVGVLVLYAGETGFFFDDEVRLMVTVANDLSLALETLEKERQRKLAEDALRDSEERFRGTFEQAAVGVAHVSAEGRYLRVNDKFCEIVGYSREEMLAMTFVELTVPEDQARSRKARSAMLAGECPSYSIEKRYRRKDGTVIWINLVTTLQRDATGKPTYSISVFQDITERKRMEAELDYERDLLRTLLENSTDHIYFKDLESRFVYFSQEMLRHFHLSHPDQLIGRTDFEFFSDEHARPAFEAEREIIRTGKPILNQEEREIHLDGKVSWVLTSKMPRHDKAGNVIGTMGISKDITERKRTEARYHRLIDSNAQSVFFWNTDGSIYECNDAFLGLVGYTRDDLEAGRLRWAAITPPEYADRDRQALDELTATGISKSYEKEFICKDGSRVPILVGSAIFEDNSKEGVCFVLDLSERKKLEAQFLRAQRMESIGTLAGGIAHDLNNILAPIMMSIDILKLSATDPQMASILETIGLSAKRGADIVRQVLSFARGVEGERVEVQPKHLLKDLEHIIKDTFPKDIRLHFSIPHETWTLLGDPTQIHQILLNLCVNSRDAMPNGGSLTIGAENCLLDEQYVAMNIQAKAGRYVRISVTDSGTGIPPGVLDKIFEPFFTTKDLNKGTGLGLSTVMAIVKSHDGIINVYSEPGKGTTFKVYLPALEMASEGHGNQTQSVDLPRGNGETVLIVDDEASVLAITGKTLQAFGYRVLTAANGANAIAVYAESKNEIAVVLTDMMMPIMDGPATIQALKQLNPAVKIIAASGLNTNDGVLKASGLGLKHFLTKPYTAGTLLKTLRAILDEA
jgi:PAS domain S-box-containing protein